MVGFGDGLAREWWVLRAEGFCIMLGKMAEGIKIARMKRNGGKGLNGIKESDCGALGGSSLPLGSKTKSHIFYWRAEVLTSPEEPIQQTPFSSTYPYFQSQQHS